MTAHCDSRVVRNRWWCWWSDRKAGHICRCIRIPGHYRPHICDCLAQWTTRPHVPDTRRNQ